MGSMLKVGMSRLAIIEYEGEESTGAARAQANKA